MKALPSMRLLGHFLSHFGTFSLVSTYPFAVSLFTSVLIFLPPLPQLDAQINEGGFQVEPFA